MFHTTGILLKNRRSARRGRKTCKYAMVPLYFRRYISPPIAVPFLKPTVGTAQYIRA